MTCTRQLALEHRQAESHFAIIQDASSHNLKIRPLTNLFLGLLSFDLFSRDQANFCFKSSFQNLDPLQPIDFIGKTFFFFGIKETFFSTWMEKIGLGLFAIAASLIATHSKKPEWLGLKASSDWLFWTAKNNGWQACFRFQLPRIRFPAFPKFNR